MRIVDFFREGAPASVADAVASMETILVKTRRMWIASTGHLLYNDPLDIDLEKVDEDVDEQERRIRRVIKDHISGAPRSELQLSLAILSVVQDGERIGDLAKSIGQLAGYAEKPLISPHTATLRSHRERITAMFDQTRAGFVDADVVEGQSVMKANEQIKADLRTFVQRLSVADGISTNEAVLLANGALMMGRVSSHLSNIASTVVLPFEQIRGDVARQA